VVVLIDVVGDDAVNARAGHFEERVVDEIGIPRIVESLGEELGPADAVIKFTDGQESRVARKIGWRDVGDNGNFAEKIESGLECSLYTHNAPPFASKPP